MPWPGVAFGPVGGNEQPRRRDLDPGVARDIDVADPAIAKQGPGARGEIGGRQDRYGARQDAGRERRDLLDGLENVAWFRSSETSIFKKHSATGIRIRLGDLRVHCRRGTRVLPRWSRARGNEELSERPVPTSANLRIPDIAVPGRLQSNRPTTPSTCRTRTGRLRQRHGQLADGTRSWAPVGISFWAGPGDEPLVLRVASACEAATRHRRPPPDFGPVDR